MLKEGRKALKGHRMELVIIELWLCLCWLVPIAAELTVRRFVPATTLWQTVTLLGSFLLNRLLLAPAHTGYYACCRRLASATAQMAATCEIGDLREEWMAPTLLRCFFLDYRHPIKSLKWQLRWDALRFAIYAVLLFPAFLFIAVGAGEESALLQAVCGAGGLLLGFAGLLAAFLIIGRLRPCLYRRPQYGVFWKQVLAALRTSRYRMGEMALMYVKVLCVPPVLCPLLSFRTAFYIEQATLFQTPIPVKTKKHRLRIFHTRVLHET